jgi:hypothetical protein
VFPGTEHGFALNERGVYSTLAAEESGQLRSMQAPKGACIVIGNGTAASGGSGRSDRAPSDRRDCGGRRHNACHARSGARRAPAHRQAAVAQPSERAAGRAAAVAAGEERRTPGR